MQRIRQAKVPWNFIIQSHASLFNLSYDNLMHHTISKSYDNHMKYDASYFHPTLYDVSYHSTSCDCHMTFIIQFILLCMIQYDASNSCDCHMTSWIMRHGIVWWNFIILCVSNAFSYDFYWKFTHGTKKSHEHQRKKYHHLATPGPQNENLPRTKTQNLTPMSHEHPQKKYHRLATPGLYLKTCPTLTPMLAFTTST